MATLKLTIDTRNSCANGKYPIIFRLTVNSVSTSISSGIRLHKNEWDNTKGKVLKAHPKYKELNIGLSKRMAELESKLITFANNNELVDIKELKSALLQDNQPKRHSFFDFAYQEIKILRDLEKFGNAQVYETAVNSFSGFCARNVKIDEVNYSLISNYDYYLIKKGLSQNSISVYMRGLRALLNKAIKKGLVERNKYPFTSYKVKTEKTISRAINKDDLEKIRAEQLKIGSKLWHSRNIFFLIFNLIGISFIDLVFLRKENLIDERIVFKRRKTGKLYSIKITDEAKQLIKLYEGNNNHYLITIIGRAKISKEKEKHEVNLKLKTINKYLKKLGKQCELPIPLTTYVARYSWANIAKTHGYSKDLIAEALGHEYGNRITGIYLDNYGSEIIDNANIQITTFRNGLE